MSGAVRPSVAMFRMPGYPWISEEVQSLLDKSVRVLDDVDVDPLDVANDLAEVCEVVAQLLRDFGAEALIGQAS